MSKWRRPSLTFIVINFFVFFKRCQFFPNFSFQKYQNFETKPFENPIFVFFSSTTQTLGSSTSTPAKMTSVKFIKWTLGMASRR